MATKLVWHSSFFKFPEDIRKAIYTTNASESTNRQISGFTSTVRKIIKNNGVFPDDKSIQKIIFMVLTNASKNEQCLLKIGRWF